MNTNTSFLLSSLYGNTSSLGSIGTTTTSSTLSPTVAARIQQALSGQQGNINKLNASLTADQTRLSGLGQLQSALAAFETIAEGLSGAGLATTAASSNKDVLSVATTAAAQVGTYKVNVKQLAQGQILSSGTQLTATTRIGTGTAATVKLDWGTLGDSGFKVDSASSKTLTIDSSNNTLDGIAAALKQQGVDASVVKGDAGYSLQIKGKDGAAQTLRISVTGDASLKAAIGFDPANPTATGMSQAQAAQDALLTVGDKDFSSSTNTVTDALPGATLTLTGKGETEVTVNQDPGQIAKNVANFVDGYNKLTAQLTALQQGPLKGNQALATVTSQLQSLVRVDGAGATAQGLAAAGLSFDSKGTLKLDETKLKAAIEDNPKAVSKLFTDEGKGLADKLDKKIDSLTADRGIVTRTQTQVTRSLDTLETRKDRLAQSLTTQAQALAQLYTMQEQMGGTGSFLDMLG